MKSTPKTLPQLIAEYHEWRHKKDEAELESQIVRGQIVEALITEGMLPFLKVDMPSLEKYLKHYNEN